MKSKISKILGVGLTIALLASLLVMTVPASASDLLWSAQATPSALTFQVAAGTDASFLTVAPNGTTIFVVDTQAATDVVYKSADSGLTWTPSALNPWATTNITALAVSSNYAADSTVVVTAGNLVYISTNGGATFGQLGGVVATGEIVTSVAISPTYSSDGEIMVGTQHPNASTNGTVYIWNKSGVLNWVAQGALAEDITSVAFSPNYPIDATILAVGSDNVSGTRLHTKVSTFAWDATIGAAIAINAAVGVGDGATAIASSSLVMGSDYNGSLAATRRVYVATMSGLTTDNIYQVGIAANAMNPTTGDAAFVKLAFNGTVTAGTLFATQNGTAAVYRSANPTAVIGWQFLPPTTNPSGAANSWVALAPDFATSNTVYVGTTGAESAVSVSTDGGVNFYQSGMVDTVLDHFADFQASPAFATDNTLFLVTASATANTSDSAPESLWKSTNGGTTWIRALTLVAGNNQAIVRPSPNYATDTTIYFAETGNGTNEIRLSNDGGSSWVPRISSVAINDLLVASSTTVYVANQAGGTVVRSINGAWTWSTKALTGSAAVFKLALAPNGDIIAGTNAGLVYRSTDSGTSFVIHLAGLGGGNVNQLAVDANYATNGAIYAASSTAVGVWRAQTGDTTWGQITAAIPAGAVSGLAASADGSLYAADATAATATVGGILRSLTPTTLLVLAPASFEAVSVGDGLTAGYTLASLFGAPVSSTKLFAIENSGGAGANRVRTYTDTIVGAPVISLESVSPTTAAFSWTGITGATSYQLWVNTRADFAGVAQTITGYIAPETNGLSTGLAPGTTYYAMVRVAAAGVGAPVLSRWSNIVTLQTQMATVAAPVAILPLPASQDISVTPSFSWGAVAGAASYTIELDTNPDFSSAISASVLINAWQSPEALEYNHTYYWRVTAISSSGAPASAPVIGVFTTEAEPAPVVVVPIAEVAIVTPISGATVVIEPTFVWSAYEGAIRYEIMVSTENDFSIIEYSHSVPVANTFYKSETLAYDTTYYWRVRGITGEQTNPYLPAPGGAWATGIFTTEAKPVPPAVVEKAEPIVIVEKEPAPPPVIVEVEKQVLIPAEPQAIPNYLLWTIIGIGSALIVSLVVLIARTRRVT